jgi:hypothetical protein
MQIMTWWPQRFATESRIFYGYGFISVYPWQFFKTGCRDKIKKACSEKSRPLLTYEKHHFKDM